MRTERMNWLRGLVEGSGIGVRARASELQRRGLELVPASAMGEDGAQAILYYRGQLLARLRNTGLRWIALPERGRAFHTLPACCFALAASACEHLAERRQPSPPQEG